MHTHIELTSYTPKLTLTIDAISVILWMLITMWHTHKYRRAGFLYGFYFCKLACLQKVNPSQKFYIILYCTRMKIKSKRTFKIYNIKLFPPPYGSYNYNNVINMDV